MHYQYHYDSATRLLDLKLTGLWDEAVVERFMGEAGAIRAGVIRAGHRDTGGRILLDLANFPVQPRAVTESLGGLLPLFGDHAGRVAVVHSLSPIQQMQLQRLLPLDKVRFFPDRAAGMAWLDLPA